MSPRAIEVNVFFGLLVILIFSNFAFICNSKSREIEIPTNLAFALTQTTNPLNDRLISHKLIDGLSIQLSWSQLEPSDNIHDFKALDDVLLKIKKANKKSSIHVFGGFGSPLWLKKLGVRFYEFVDIQGRTKYEPVPWDETYLSKHEEFLTAFSKHLKEKDLLNTIFDISIATPVTEMSIIPCKNGVIPPDIMYDRTRYLNAWKRMINTYHINFINQNKFISAPVRVICAPEKDASFYIELLDYALLKSDKFWMFAADLKSDGSWRMSSYLSLVDKYKLAYQTLWYSTKDSQNRMRGVYPSNLKQAVCKGLEDGATYFEFYAVDVVNTNECIQEAIETVKESSLCQCP